MRIVRLYGELADKYGKEFRMNVSSVGEAIRLLSANFKGFKQYLVDSDTRLQGYEVWDGDYNLEGDQKEFVKQGEGDIKIIPVVKGASSTARIIAGVVLIVVGIALWWAGGTYATYAGSALLSGAMLVAGGIAEKLANTAKTDQESDDVASADSYLFSGAVNMVKQGNPVQIGYGKMLVGSNVISASVVVEDYPVNA